ncbi:hypothetical protein ACFQL4_27795 [Halosimplex aquaticum]
MALSVVFGSLGRISLLDERPDHVVVGPSVGRTRLEDVVPWLGGIDRCRDVGVRQDDRLAVLGLKRRTPERAGGDLGVAQ